MVNAFVTFRGGIDRAYEGGQTLASGFLDRIRPRTSLASGSVLVLLTLFLPIGYDACAPPRNGVELLRGKGDWPTLMGLASSAAGRDYYSLALLLASFTILLVLLSALRAGVLCSPRLIPRLALFAGTLALFLVCDVTLLLAALAGDQAGPAAVLPLAASCLAPGIFWPRKGYAAWISALVITGCLLLIADRLGVSLGEPVNWIVLAVESVYALLPLGLWYRYGFSPRPELHAQWQVIRRGLVAFYLAAVPGNFWFLGIAVQEGLWGFVPCYFGIHLIAFGYLRLLREGPSVRGSPVETAPTGTTK